MISQRARRTGRTTEMMEAVLRDVQEGKKVVVVAAYPEQARVMRILAVEGKCDEEACNIKKSLDKITFIAVGGGNITGGRRWNKAYVDHYAWEARPFATAHELVNLEPLIGGQTCQSACAGTPGTGGDDATTHGHAVRIRSNGTDRIATAAPLREARQTCEGLASEPTSQSDQALSEAQCQCAGFADGSTTFCEVHSCGRDKDWVHPSSKGDQ